MSQPPMNLPSTNTWGVVGQLVKAHSAGRNSGSAYVFRHEDNGTPLDWSDDLWVEVDKLTASDASEGDFFGISVSNTLDRAIVGAMQDDDAGSGSGSAYIFRRHDNDVEGYRLTTANRGRERGAPSLPKDTLSFRADTSPLAAEPMVGGRHIPIGGPRPAAVVMQDQFHHRHRPAEPDLDNASVGTERRFRDTPRWPGRFLL